MTKLLKVFVLILLLALVAGCAANQNNTVTDPSKIPGTREANYQTGTLYHANKVVKVRIGYITNSPAGLNFQGWELDTGKVIHAAGTLIIVED